MKSRKWLVYLLGFALLPVSGMAFNDEDKPKSLDVTVGLYSSYSPHCNLVNDISLYYAQNSMEYQKRFVLRSKINTTSFGGFFDLKYFRFAFYGSSAVNYNSTYSPGAFAETFKKNTFSSNYTLSVDGNQQTKLTTQTEYVPVTYKTTTYTFCFKYPVKDLFFPYLGLGFNNTKKMDLDGNGADDFSYGVPNQQFGIYGHDTAGSVSGRTRNMAFITLGLGLIKHIGDFNLEFILQSDFGIDGRNPYTGEYANYYEQLYTSGAQSAQLKAKPTSYFKLALGLTLSYTFKLDKTMFKS